MNNDLISREALKKEITANHYLLSARNNSIDYGMFTTGIMQTIDNAPTVDMNTELSVAYLKGRRQGQSDERPTGEWIGNNLDEHVCNKCGHYALYEEEHDGQYYEVQSRFCPNCGVKMKEAENDKSI